MNVFVTDLSPLKSAMVLPDRHITKMPVETCQMLALIASKWFHGYGDLPKADGTPYKTAKGAFRKHPCTLWAAETEDNASWLLEHGLALCNEFFIRYGKKHSCCDTLLHAKTIFPKGNLNNVKLFVRAMPDEYKLDTSIDTFTAYQMYISSKPWVKSNYMRLPERKPEWV
jgi:hypothetical protein